MILKGNDALEKANKMMESLNVSQKVDSFSNVEKIFSAYNGKRYGILKEGTKYIIKEAVAKNAKNPSDFEYIDGVQNKSKYSKNTLLEAEKTLNLWNIEFSRVYGTSLVKEQDEMEDEEPTKKTVLKVPVKKSADAAPMDTAAPMDMPTGEEGMPTGEEGMPTGEEGMPTGEEGMPTGEEGMPEEGGEEEGEEGVDPKKSIQKLAGKLAYELREFEGEDEDYSDIYKFAASMVISAADADKITEKDKNSIKKKVEKSLTVDEEDELPEGGDEELPEETEEMPTGEEDTEETEEMPEEGMEKTLAEALKRIKEAKKGLGNREVLDRNKNGKLDKEDFKMLRQSKKEGEKTSLKEDLEGKPISAWIKDFVNSTNPKFKGKSKKKRREMAIAAFLESERSQGKDSSVTYVKGKKSKEKKSLKEGSDYGMPMDEDYMMEDDFRFDEGKKKNELLLDYPMTEEDMPMTEEDLYEEDMPMTEEDLYEEDMPMTEEDLYEEDMPMTEEDLYEEDMPMTEEDLYEEDMPMTEDYMMSEEDMPMTEEDLYEEDMPMTEDYMMSEEDMPMTEEDLYEEDMPMTEEDLYELDLYEEDMPMTEDYMMSEEDLYEEDMPMTEDYMMSEEDMPMTEEDYTFEMDYSQKKK